MTKALVRLVATATTMQPSAHAWHSPHTYLHVVIAVARCIVLGTGPTNARRGRRAILAFTTTTAAATVASVAYVDLLKVRLLRGDGECAKRHGCSRRVVQGIVCCLAGMKGRWRLGHSWSSIRKPEGAKRGQQMERSAIRRRRRCRAADDVAASASTTISTQ
jgi:hypothetical protein